MKQTIQGGRGRDGVAGKDFGPMRSLIRTLNRGLNAVFSIRASSYSFKNWFGIIGIPVVVIILLLLSAIRATGQDGDRLDLARKVTFHVRNSSLSSALSDLSAVNHVPIGLESLSDELEAGIAININASEEPLRSILDNILKQDPRYRWELRNGVINVFPSKAGAGFLDVVVLHFEEKDIDAEDVPALLMSKPEVQLRLASLGMTYQGGSQYDGPYRSLPRFSIKLSNKTVREMLNELTRRGYTHCWRTSRYGAAGKYVYLSL
jgi:hypothetical protein